LWLNTSFSLLSTTATTTSAAHEHAEDVVHAATAAASTGLETFHAVFVIDISLLLVEKDFVGSLNFFELLNL
jgi:hypothetical protein